MSLLRWIGRRIARLVPSRYTSRRDRMSQEQDQLTLQNQFRSGM